MTECNQTSLMNESAQIVNGGQISTVNRCLNVFCEIDIQCMSMLACIGQKCSIKLAQIESSAYMNIILVAVFCGLGFCVLTAVAYLICRHWCKRRNLVIVTIHNNTNINISTENSMIANGTPIRDDSVHSIPSDQFSVMNDISHQHKEYGHPILIDPSKGFSH
ncbi:hypothetical protein FGO68_gene649 [Halteria grandinella]|uniref:Uncharacterized protein n=1 Tax=Halteria grandinella TaxID=5974 RepID=A0A8J8NZA7_HALGN|nr:hypothetical protein FGO68_gene649 [Halteria grandinella]